MHGWIVMLVNLRMGAVDEWVHKSNGDMGGETRDGPAFFWKMCIG